MLTIKITIGADGIEVIGDAKLAEVLPLIQQWFETVRSKELDSEKLREITARLSKSTNALSDVERADAGH